MSDLYNSLYKELDPKRYDKRDADGKEIPFDLVRMEVGTTFEELLEVALARSLFGDRPGEFRTTPDDVIFTPDYLFFNGETILGEFKCTWYSSRNAPFEKKFDKWICQIKAYCFHLKISKAWLYVLFVNGDYSYKPPHGGPCLLKWELEFTRAELEREWAMLRRHAVKKGMLK